VVDSANQHYSVINDLLCTKDGKTVIACLSGLTYVTFPLGVTTIGGYIFRGYTSLISVTIPSSVTSIGDEAFRGCSSLTSVVIPEGVTLIGSNAFYGVAPVELTAAWLPSGMSSNNITSVTIPEGVISIREKAFYKCVKLTSITIPFSVTTIGDGAFSECYQLESVYFNGNPPSVGQLAFKTFGSVVPIGYYKSNYATEWKKTLGGNEEGYLYSGTIYIRPLNNRTTYSLRSSRIINTRNITPTTLDLKRIEKVEQVNSVNRFTQANHHKSNLYSIEIEDLGLNSLEKTENEKVKSAVKNIKKSIINNIKKICQNTQPGNTQLFSVFFTGN
jgi:hypothetical protein